MKRLFKRFLQEVAVDKKTIVIDCINDLKITAISFNRWYNKLANRSGMIPTRAHVNKFMVRKWLNKLDASGFLK